MTVVPQIGRSEKLPEVTARKIFEDVVERGWPVGELLGSEAELIARYGVSRAVLREAVRLLEHLQIARMRRGPGGGLFVTAPGVEATTEAIARHVERNRITPAQLFEVRSAIEMAVLDRVLEHPDPAIVACAEGGARRRAVGDPVGVRHGRPRPARRARRAVGQSGAAAVDPGVGPPHPQPGDPAGGRGRPVADRRRSRTSTRGLVDAIIAGDRELARHRARHHLTELERWVR